MNFDSILNDILTIPKALLTSLKYYLSSEGKEKLESLRRDAQQQKIKRIMLIGHTYAYFASITIFRYLNSKYHSNIEGHEDLTKKICINYELDEFISYYNPLQDSGETIYLFVSRSGNSNEIQKAIHKLLNSKINPEHIWGVSNDTSSFLSSNSYHFLPINFGTEEITGTKSYINAILVLYLIGRSIMNKDALPDIREDEIRRLIFEIKFYGQDWQRHTKNLTDFLGENIDNLFFISKGASLSTAYQASLNFKAYTRTFCVAISTGLFLNGPFQIVDDSFRCILIIGDETSIEETKRLINLITKKGSGKMILINNSRKLSSIGRSNKKNIFVFEHTTENTYLSPIFEIYALFYLIFQIAKNQGVVE